MDLKVPRRSAPELVSPRWPSPQSWKEDIVVSIECMIYVYELLKLFYGIAHESRAYHGNSFDRARVGSVGPIIGVPSDVRRELTPGALLCN